MSFRAIGRIGATAILLSIGVLPGCGDDGSRQELPSRTAASLRSTLDEVEQRVDVRDCSGASERAASFRAEVAELPSGVDGDLRRALSSSADRLESLIADQCVPQQAPVEEPPVGATSQDQVTQPPDENAADQQGNAKKDKQPKEKKPKKDEPPPDTGGAGQEDQGVNQQDGTAPPGQ